MRRILLSLAALATIAAAPAVANAHPRVAVGFAAPAPGIHVRFAPPAPRFEVRPVAPYHGAIWSAGHWQWNGYRHVWAPGFYHAPRVGWVWEPGHWQPQFAGGFIYIPGHWRRAWQPTAYYYR